MPKVFKEKVSAKEKNNWIRLIDDLMREIESWAGQRKWGVQRDSKSVQEPHLGDYTVPVLSILAPAGRVQIDPVARFVAGGDGRVDLLAWPSQTRMLLVRVSDSWVLKTDSGVVWPEAWNQQTFVGLIGRLNSAA